MLKPLLLVTVLLGASSAFAHSARLLAPDVPEVGRAGVSLAPRAAPASTAFLRGATIGVGIAAVPLSLWVASAIGHLSNNLIAAALPTLLLMGFLAPTITALVSWVMANTNVAEGQHTGFWLPWLGAVGTNIVLLVIGGFIGLSVGSPAPLMLFSVIDGVAMGFATTGIQQLQGRTDVAVSTLNTHVAGETPMTIVPLSKVAF